ncbi:hypothetical protein [Streptomyces sp. NPDC005784]|uniref:hypothetical protein n=1 Tax=Streptomyces sp. NPDC005784 TaxID=3364731 RepID=UPI0036B173E1
MFVLPLGDRTGRPPIPITVFVPPPAADTVIGTLPAYGTVGTLTPWPLTVLRVGVPACSDRSPQAEAGRGRRRGRSGRGDGGAGRAGTGAPRLE